MHRFRFTSLRRRAPVVLAAAFAIGVLTGATGAARAGQFGTRCQQDFQSSWQNNLSYVWGRCSGFNNELDDSDTKLFYFNLHDSFCGFSSCDGSTGAGGVDAVDLFYVSTHGGTNATDAILAMWNNGVFSSSSNYRLGNNADEARIYSQYSCGTLSNADGKIWTRWKKAFKGGLQIVTGSHDKVYDGWTTEETGEDYADDLQDGKSVKWAWFDGNSDWYHDQDVAVVATGTSVDNCKGRRNGFTWQNIAGFSQLRDGDAAFWCRSRIDG